MNKFSIYWEKVDNFHSDEFLTTAATFNNLFGFHFLDEGHRVILENSRKNRSFESTLTLIHQDLLSFIEPLEEACHPLNLKLIPIDSISSSSCFLVKSRTGLFPYKKLNHFWVSVSPSMARPTFLLPSDMQNEITSIGDKEQIFEVLFTVPDDTILNTSVQTSIIPGPSLIEVQVCKPNGHFISLISKTSHPIHFLYSQLVRLTGYSNFKLIQKQSHSKKRVLTNFSLPVSSVIESARQNILFMELPRSTLI